MKYTCLDILNAIFYVGKNGCTWRDIPGDRHPGEYVFITLEDLLNLVFGRR